MIFEADVLVRVQRRGERRFVGVSVRGAEAPGCAPRRGHVWRPLAGDDPFQLTFRRERRLLRDADRGAQLVVRGGDGGHPGVVPLLARDHRLPAFRQIVRDAVHRRIDDQRLSAGVAIFRVHVRRDLLQVPDQQRLKVHDRVRLFAERRDRRLDGPLRVAMSGGVAVETIDEL